MRVLPNIIHPGTRVSKENRVRVVYMVVWNVSIWLLHVGLAVFVSFFFLCTFRQRHRAMVLLYMFSCFLCSAWGLHTSLCFFSSILFPIAIFIVYFYAHTREGDAG